MYGVLAEIDVATKSLQARGHILARCPDDPDGLIETIGQEKSKAGSALHWCKLGTHYI